MTAIMKQYADVVRAYLDGEDVLQYRWKNSSVGWVDVDKGGILAFDNPSCEYRIKPKEPRIVEKYIPVGVKSSEFMGQVHHTDGVFGKAQPHWRDELCEYQLAANILIRCNEETGEILSCELVRK